MSQQCDLRAFRKAFLISNQLSHLGLKISIISNFSVMNIILSFCLFLKVEELLRMAALSLLHTVHQCLLDHCPV